jgi:hypothetical protein
MNVKKSPYKGIFFVSGSRQINVLALGFAVGLF